jgi:transcriptional regulator with XRE-family HTH domain
MPRRKVNYESAPAAVVEAVERLGRNISLARVRRQLPEDDLAKHAGISRVTMRRVERGELGTGIGAYAAVLWALGFQGDLEEILSPERDLEGQTLEASRYGSRVRPAKGLSDDF